MSAEIGRRTVLAAGVVASGGVILGVPGIAAATTDQQTIDAKKRLAAQGYYCGDPTPVVDELTVCAVRAYQRANGMTPDGLLDSQMVLALQKPRTPVRFTSSRSVVEIDIARQLLRIVVDGKVLATVYASTGDGGAVDLGGRSVLGRTPLGQFRLREGEVGERVDSLGVQTNPHDFCPGGYAIYGRDDLSTVTKPDTHGGVAVHVLALTWLEQQGHLPAGRRVLVA